VEAILARIPDGRDRALFALIYDCGLRTSEALAIKCEDLDWHERAIRIAGKGGKLREAFLSRQVARLLGRGGVCWVWPPGWGAVIGDPQMLHRASVGDRRAARSAGRRPARAPMMRAAANPPAQARGGTSMAQCWVVA
jgi:site-specific recombinase XerC